MSFYLTRTVLIYNKIKIKHLSPEEWKDLLERAKKLGDDEDLE